MGNVKSVKCLSCEAPLKFDAKEEVFKCNYCGNVYTLEDINRYKKILKEQEEVEKAREEEAEEFEKEPKTFNADSYICENCGANIILGENTSSTSCIYCKSTALIKNRLSGLYAPSKIILFKYDKKDAIERFKKLCKGRLFIPNGFCDEKNIQDMEGLYVPFWLYKCVSRANLSAKCTRVTVWADSKYRYTKTDFYSVDNSADIDYSDIPNDASRRFDDKIMNAIEPFNYIDFKDFDIKYLSGYISEKYDVEADEALENVRTRIIENSKDFLYNKINGYATKTLTSFDTNIDVNNKDYCLLPVWVLNIKYKDKIYRFSMNGQTGKYTGEIPVSKTKMFIFFFILFIVISAVSLIFIK